jgi:hypothetical protein
MQLARREISLGDARLLAAELDARYRGPELTLRPLVAPPSLHDPRGMDFKVQLLCHPVGTVEIPPERHKDGMRVLTFTDIVAAMDGPTLHTPRFGLSKPGQWTWGPTISSLEDSWNAPDGQSATLTVSVGGYERTLDIPARYDHVGSCDSHCAPVLLVGEG